VTSAALTSRRPYLLRAMHEWITDNAQTPHIVVDATVAGVEVPQAYVRDGKIILNVSHSATHGLTLGNDRVGFRARFGGATHDVVVPVAAILGIYARETGQGMIFAEGEEPPPEPPAPDEPTGSEGSRRAHLKVVK
jgi:stringent starvation protein B